MDLGARGTDEARRRPVIVGTAGHVDHGKTALVKALTGVDTDRLPEERSREISIELGFAPLTLPDGTTCSIVDVPGHERFIKNMLAGATAVDVALLVVDAGEGPRLQTIEHLDILGLLGVSCGVAALTKIDTLAPAEVAPAAARLTEFLRETCLVGCPVVPVSARTGEGLDRLRAVLEEAVRVAEAKRADNAAEGPVRLAVDRAFVAAGFGVVVTGTVASGRVRAGQRLEVYPRGPVVRVRRVEVHGRPVDEVVAGDRAALNLAGAPPAVSLRGMVLAEPGSLTPSTVAGLLLRLLPRAAPLRDLERVRLHAGTTEVIGRVAILDGRRELTPSGSPAPVAFEAEKTLALAAGQAFVIRAYSPPVTIGGGTVVLPDLAGALGGAPPRGRKLRQEAARRLTAPVAAPRVLADGRHTVDDSLYQAVKSEVGRCLGQQHEAKPHLPSLGREVLWSLLEGKGLAPGVWLETLARDGLLVLEEGRVRLASWSSRRDEAVERAASVVERALLGGGFSPPSFGELVAAASATEPEGSEGSGRSSAGAGAARAAVAAALEALILDGVAVAPGGVAGALAGEPVFHREAVAEARRRLEGHLDRHVPVTVAAFRDLIGSTRRFALPLLEYFDREKVTQRRGDLRVRHPANPPPSEGAVR